MIPRPPLMPPPPREFFKSDAAYRAAKANYNRAMRSRDEADKWGMASVLVIMGLGTALLVGLWLYILLEGFGWRGPASAFSIAGLIWVAVVQVKNRL